MQLRDLDQAIPSPLVEDYAASTSEYADEGFFWLPLIASSSEDVSRIAGGFQGRGYYTMHADHYDEVPAHIAQQLVDKAQKEKDAAASSH